MQVQCLFCDNAGENQAFERTCKQEGLGLDFEYTAPGTPQQNGHVQSKLTTFFNRVHTILNGGKFTTYLQSSLWAEAANTAMLLKNNLINPNRTQGPFQQFFGKGKKDVLASMQKFGETCIATFKDYTHWAKLANYGAPGIWVGYAKNHPPGTYWIFNPNTKNVFDPGRDFSTKVIQ